MTPKRPDGAESGRARTAGWSAAVVFDALAPLVIELGILVFVILAFVESSPDYP
jgi:hypothetical protein